MTDEGDRDEAIAEWADDLGLDYDDAESLFDTIGGDPDSWDVPMVGDRPDPDYFEELAEAYDLDVSDLYDMFYGYEPGSHGR